MDTSKLLFYERHNRRWGYVAGQHKSGISRLEVSVNPIKDCTYINAHKTLLCPKGRIRIWMGRRYRMFENVLSNHYIRLLLRLFNLISYFLDTEAHLASCKYRQGVSHSVHLYQECVVDSVWPPRHIEPRAIISRASIILVRPDLCQELMGVSICVFAAMKHYV